MTISHFPVSDAGRAGVAAIGALLAARPDGPDISLTERRAWLEAFAANAPPAEGVEIAETTLGGVATLRVSPPGACGDILFLHGGAYVLGSANTHKGLAARYALASGATFHVIDYRLAPEHPYPAALGDALAAWRALTRMGPALLMGDSAGGGLALATAIACRDGGLVLPRAVAMAAPWIDLALTGASMDSNAAHDAMLSRAGLAADADRYRDQLPADDPRISPLLANLSGLPPLLVQVGTAEVLLDDAVRLHDRATAAGTPCNLQLWEGMTHAWAAFGPAVPEAALSITAMGAMLREYLR
jgi:epsilon-lactone hydrolase